jgi:hypothetical protein
LLEAKLVPGTPGLVLLIANAGLLVGNTRKKVTFNWQWSLDGKTWTSAASTPLADTEIQNLTLGTTYMFRVSVTISKVAGAWSENPVILLVK